MKAGKEGGGAFFLHTESERDASAPLDDGNNDFHAALVFARGRFAKQPLLLVRAWKLLRHSKTRIRSII